MPTLPRAEPMRDDDPHLPAALAGALLALVLLLAAFASTPASATAGSPQAQITTSTGETA